MDLFPSVTKHEQRIGLNVIHELRVCIPTLLVNKKNDLIPDKVHPNAKGATIIAKEVAKSILNS